MVKKKDMLESMWNNPAGDWTIQDFILAADAVGLIVRRASTGSHWTFASPHLTEIKPVPEHRPIKPCYVCPFVKFARSHVKLSMTEPKVEK